MATAATIHRTSGDSYSSRSSYVTDSDEDNRTGLRSSVAVVSRAPKRERMFSDSTPPHVTSTRNKSKGNDEWVEKQGDNPPDPKKKKEDVDPILTKTGGAYIPPARLRMMQEQIKDKSSTAYQRMAWEALKKSINGLINKVNVSNIKDIIRELFQENVIRGRGLLARSVITAQSASPTFSHVYAALVAVVNTKFPQTGELIAKRLILNFKKGFRRNNKNLCLSSVRFIAHLVNQQVLHELLALEILTLLLEDPTSDSVEVGIGFLKECGQKLTELSPAGVHGVFESLKGILHDGNVDVRVQYMIEVMYAVRKDSFKEHPSIVDGLDLVDEEDQITHLLSLEDELDGEDALHIFKMDPEYLENEDRYKAIKEDILGSSDDEDESGDEDSESGEDEEEGTQTQEGEMTIIDETQTNLVSLRRTIYLTIMSSLDFEECAHKLMKMTIKPGQEMEVANMIIECCSQERSYQRFYGLLGERFCHLNEMWVEKFDVAFQEQYTTVHRLETNKLRNVAKFFAQLFYTDALPWTSLSCVHLNEEETNSSSRIFVKILFQELAEYMGLQKLNERLKDPFLSESFEGLLPRDNPRNTRFAINFFTSIGLGGLTDDLREHLKNAPKRIMEQQQDVESDSDSSSSDSDSDSDSDDSSSETDSSSESSESESEDSEEERQRRRKLKGKGSEKKERRNRKEEEDIQGHENDRSRRRDLEEAKEERRQRHQDEKRDRRQRDDRRDRREPDDRQDRRQRDDKRDRREQDDRRDRKEQDDQQDKRQRDDKRDKRERDDRRDRKEQDDRQDRRQRDDRRDRREQDVVRRDRREQDDRNDKQGRKRSESRSGEEDGGERKEVQRKDRENNFGRKEKEKRREKSKREERRHDHSDDDSDDGDRRRQKRRREEDEERVTEARRRQRDDDRREKDRRRRSNSRSDGEEERRNGRRKDRERSDHGRREVRGRRRDDS